MSFVDIANVIAEQYGWPVLTHAPKRERKTLAKGYLLEYCRLTHIHIPELQIENMRGKETGTPTKPWEWKARKGSGNFYQSKRWLAVRYDALKRSSGACELCGAKDELHVDHIKPRSLFPELAYELSNLQVLCKSCNFGKGNRDETDWRSN